MLQKRAARSTWLNNYERHLQAKRDAGVCHWLVLDYCTAMRTIPEQRELEFQKLESLATAYLRFPHTIPKADDIGRWRFCLRLWHSPSFSESRAWGLYQAHEHGSRQIRSLVRQVTWDRLSDADRLFRPLIGLERGFDSCPTIEVRDRPISTTELDLRINELAGIAFPAFATRGIGIDGETFGIEFPHHGSRVQWWCEGPESWSDLTSWAVAVRDWLCSVATAEPERHHWDKPRPKLP